MRIRARNVEREKQRKREQEETKRGRTTRVSPFLQQGVWSVWPWLRLRLEAGMIGEWGEQQAMREGETEKAWKRERGREERERRKREARKKEKEKEGNRLS